MRALVLVGCLIAVCATGWAQECPPPYNNPSDLICQGDGETVSTGTAACCDGLAPVRDSGCKCRPVGPTTTTLPSATTTTTPTGATTTTLVLGSFPVARFAPEDLSRSYPASTEIRWDPRDGSYADQYVRQIRVETMHGVIVPAMLRAFRDLPSCRGSLDWAAGVYTTLGKFVIRYAFRDLPEPYAWEPNYVMDLYQSLLKRLAACADPADLSPTLQAVIRSDWSVPDHQDAQPALEMVGVFDPQHPFAALTSEQCAALAETGRLHDLHAAALLAHDAATAALYPTQIRAAHERFTSLARDPWEATMFDMVFTGEIDVVPGDGFCTQDRADQLTVRTILTHDRWVEAFHCDTGDPPDVVLVAQWMWRHWREHAIRAACVPDLAFVEPIFDPETEPGLAAVFPFCVPGPSYDIHYCPDLTN